ncbi:MBL fold metallo-hydrolase [Pseudemcibacter aquimaris]|uniref:MBL fold metallo-hydrolase n=1 Tax=Pseudemcibacter aquimaris TaxID=2857064 RepID=UPI002012550E|nr:MBL fold metallo-hydrolase [Pseudemcibacter aquimaris]MCC3859586.1 MBL fold metallo-hydrolase [Pseudemcibacter aquimaris]WDU59982.1 MBL fold metallo-hydrolase [Pseudemcibacter aquimaris]
MRNIFGLLTLFMVSSAYAQDAKLCHVASAGFYATDGEKSVLLDALYRDGLDGFEQASDIVNDQMEKAEGVFSNVKLVFASHFHGDHMTGKAILRHLRANKDAVAVVTEQSRTVIAAAGIQPSDQNQVKSFNIPIGENEKLDGLAFPVTLYGISHGEGRPIENIGMAVIVSGKTIMHVGDIFAKEEDLIRAEVGEANIDYLLMPYWHMLDPETVSDINRVFKPKHIIPMHFPPASGGNDHVERLAEIKNIAYGSASNIVKLEEEMTCIALD